MRGIVTLAIVLASTAVAPTPAVPLAASPSAGGLGPERRGDPSERCASGVQEPPARHQSRRPGRAWQKGVRRSGPWRRISARAGIGGRDTASRLGSERQRWASPVGRQLTELAILTTAREHDQPYQWSLHEMEAVAVGLNPSVIDIVRHRNRIAGVAPKEAAIIQMGREIFGRHRLSSDTYARALKLFGTRDLVDLVDLMAGYSGTAAQLTAFNQHLPPGWKQFLPLPFTPSDDIHAAISRSRLPLIRSQTQPGQLPNLYSRQLAPEAHGARPHRPSRSRSAVAGGQRGPHGWIDAGDPPGDRPGHGCRSCPWSVNEIAALREGVEPAYRQRPAAQPACDRAVRAGCTR